MPIARATRKQVKVFISTAVAMLAVLLMALPSAAQAYPPDPNTIGEAVTLSSIELNGVSATHIAVSPGQPVTISANWSDSHPGFCPGCVDFLATAYEGSLATAGCIENPGFSGTNGSGAVEPRAGAHQTRHLQDHRCL